MEMGVDLIVLTGNPGNGVSNEAIVHSLESIRAQVGEGIVLAAGKMHASGVVGEGGENIITKEDVAAFGRCRCGYYSAACPRHRARHYH